MIALLLGFVALVACGVLFLLGLVAPRASKRAQTTVDRVLDDAREAAREVPDPFGKWLAAPFAKSERAADKSTRAGRKTRAKSRS